MIGQTAELVSMNGNAPAVVGGIGGAAMRGLRHGTEGPAAFWHDVGGSYDDLGSVTGIERYIGRPLVTTLSTDVIHLPPNLQDDYAHIMEHYRSTGLECAAKVSWGGALQPAQYPGHVPSVFLFNEQAHRLAPDQQRFEAVKRWNNKNWFADYVQQEGFPMPPTDMYARGDIPTQTFDGPYFVKGAEAATGTQVFDCNTWDEVLAQAAKMKGDYQVQQGVDATFLNVQYNAADDGSVEFVATTEQEMDGVSHNGNRHPSEHNPRHVTDELAARAAQMGVRGIFAFDVAALKRPISTSEAYQLIECNPRPNGSSYFTATAERLGVNEWLGVNVPTQKSLRDSLDALTAARLLYDARRGSGVVIVNWGTAEDGKLGVMFIGPEGVQKKYYDATRRVLSSGNQK